MPVFFFHFAETKFAFEGSNPEQACILWHLCAIAQCKPVQDIVKLTYGNPVWEEANGRILQLDLPTDLDRRNDLTMTSNCSVLGNGSFWDRQEKLLPRKEAFLGDL
ncbi:hypothetical protein KSX_56180 [Ktedonospora formicarum]|uniref:Uncharacterized protein n=1 Tax=Ktedonospora formicarum TaxID=2778364 RepID=A0A8J3MTS4_9CHLR|nr:hypothetical protein KSX_56180 [Ktedonospora formicarum]